VPADVGNGQTFGGGRSTYVASAYEKDFQKLLLPCGPLIVRHFSWNSNEKQIEYRGSCISPTAHWPLLTAGRVPPAQSVRPEMAV